MIADGEVNAPLVDEALRWLIEQVPDATRVLDVGSGPGVAACSFAELLPKAEVVAADGAPELLELARDRAQRLGIGDRLRTVHTDLPDGLATLPPADIVWVSGVAHHMPDPPKAVHDLAALVRPGGVLALREGGLPLRFLPGYADRGLSARINAHNDELADRHEHPMGAIEAPRSWPELLAEAGLAGVTSRTFLLDKPAPLDDRDRRHLRHHLTMGRDIVEGLLSAEDLARIEELATDDGPESVLHRPDVFILRASTIHIGLRN